MRLGQIIAELRHVDPILPVRIEPYHLYVKKLRSYRGYYDQLALGYTTELGVLSCSLRKMLMTVDALLDDCRAAVGATFEGYKGGSYKMDEDTEVWISNYGEASDVVLDRIVVRDYGVSLYGREES